MIPHPVAIGAAVAGAGLLAVIVALEGRIVPALPVLPPAGSPPAGQPPPAASLPPTGTIPTEPPVTAPPLPVPVPQPPPIVTSPPPTVAPPPGAPCSGFWVTPPLGAQLADIATMWCGDSNVWPVLCVESGMASCDSDIVTTPLVCIPAECAATCVPGQTCILP